MFENFLKITLFVLVNAVGFYMIAVIGNLALKLGMFPALQTAQDMDLFKYWLFGGGMWVWIVSALMSVGYFFTKNGVKVALVLAPVYVPLLYGAAVIAYFNSAV